MLKIMKKNQGISPAMLVNKVGGVISVQLNVLLPIPSNAKGSGDEAMARVFTSHRCGLVQFPYLVSDVGQVCCWFLSLLQRFFS